MGKYINELRRKTTNEALSKRAKELVKKWRNAVLPDSNGQLKQSPPMQQEDVNLNQLKIKKRPAKEPPDITNTAKRPKMNGGIMELDFSDNSNSSFKDVIPVKTEVKQRDVIIINSDSNSSIPDKHDPQLDQQMPKKRGRKKGSRNHKNLLDEAESSFTSKLAVSRGNSKVKTTQELLASLQNKNSSLSVNSLSAKPKEDLMEKAAKLTQRVSIIDQQLNTNANRNKNSNRNKFKLEKNERVIESGSVINDKSLLSQNPSPVKEEEEEEEVNVVDAEREDDIKTEVKREIESQETENNNIITSLSVEEALAQLPPVDKSVLYDDEEVPCSCAIKEVPAAEDAEHNVGFNRYEFVEDSCCEARLRLTEKYKLDCVTDEKVHQLSSVYLPNINGNFSLGSPKPGPVMQQNGLYENVVPNVNIESIPKDVKDFSTENYSKYNFSESNVNSDIVERTEDEKSSDNSCFREWYEVVENSSYNGERLRILPYVIID